MTTEPSPPEFSTIVLRGASSALLIIWIPVDSSLLLDLILSNPDLEFNSATPPPATIPSYIAALVACRASSTLSFFSFISTSEGAPT